MDRQDGLVCRQAQAQTDRRTFCRCICLLQLQRYGGVWWRQCITATCIQAEAGCAPRASPRCAPHSTNSRNAPLFPDTTASVTQSTRPVPT